MGLPSFLREPLQQDVAEVETIFRPIRSNDENVRGCDCSTILGMVASSSSTPTTSISDWSDTVTITSSLIKRGGFAMSTLIFRTPPFLNFKLRPGNEKQTRLNSIFEYSQMKNYGSNRRLITSETNSVLESELSKII